MQSDRVRLLMMWMVLIIGLDGLFAISAGAASRGIHVKTKTPSGAVREIQLYTGYHALVVGCSEYRRGWPPLPNPVNDAREVAEALKRMGWTVQLLEDPDGRTLRSEMNRLAIGPGREKDKAIFFWFSGHGETLEEADGSRLGYLVPVDAPDPERDLLGFMDTALSMRQIETVSKQIRSKHVLMAFDSCFSGAIFQMVRARPSPYIQEKVAYPVRQFVTAGSENEQVPDKSVFKDVFLQAVTDGLADLNQDSYVTGEELGAYLQEKVINYSREAQHPQFGKINNPKLDKGDFVFTLAHSSGAYVEKPSPRAEGTAVLLSVESNIQDARVLVDGREVGLTPLDLAVVPAGKHKILVEKDGYSSYQRRLDFETGRSISLYVDLGEAKSSKGRLFVQTEPEGARVRILNIGPKFYQGIELDEGRYHVEISAAGHIKKKMWLALDAGEDRQLSIRLSSAAAGSPRIVENNLSMKFVYIKPGSFMMGSPSYESGRASDEKRHKVTLTRGYYIQMTEVTQGQWRQVMGYNPSQFSSCGDNCPVERVSWNDAQEFIRKLNRKESTEKYRLPTEAEWEYAARAGSESFYSFELSDYAWCSDNSGSKTHAVGQKKPNAWGLYDMHGSVWEWCQDWYGDYPSDFVINPRGPSSDSNRVNRGGSWRDDAWDCRSANRYSDNPGDRLNNLGFRLVRTL